MLYTFLGKPEVPTDVSITVTSSTAVTVTWSPGYDGEVSQTFYLHYKTKNEQDWMTVTVADPSTNERLSFGINGLQPSTEYVLIIFASNTQGNSSISEVFTFRTKGTLRLHIFYVYDSIVEIWPVLSMFRTYFQYR